MKMHFLVSYLMVILWVCYGYPMVLTANYPTIFRTNERDSLIAAPFAVFLYQR